jgi:hypothetical protein
MGDDKCEMTINKSTDLLTQSTYSLCNQFCQLNASRDWMIRLYHLLHAQIDNYLEHPEEIQSERHIVDTIQKIINNELYHGFNVNHREVNNLIRNYDMFVDFKIHQDSLNDLHLAELREQYQQHEHQLMPYIHKLASTIYMTAHS